MLVKGNLNIAKYKNCRLNVGLFGGSFNPAHLGHVELSKAILKKFNLDYVWWLVTPLNPLKEASGMIDYEERVRYSREIANHPKIIILDIEKRYNTTYTIDIVKKLKESFPLINFCLIMGGDNFAHFNKWHKWNEIAETIPIVIYDRGDFSYKIANSKAGIKYGKFRAKDDVLSEAPNWHFVRMRKFNISSTLIRNRGYP